MRRFLLTTAALAMVLVPATAVRAQVSFGIHIGEPPAPRAYRVPPRPGPDYVWVEGYQYPEGGHYKWHDGYWTVRPIKVRTGSSDRSNQHDEGHDPPPNNRNNRNDGRNDGR